jgi:hypothetical protein
VTRNPPLPRTQGWGNHGSRLDTEVGQPAKGGATMFLDSIQRVGQPPSVTRRLASQ